MRRKVVKKIVVSKWDGRDSYNERNLHLFNNVIAESLDAQFWSNFNAKSIGTSSSDKP